MLSFAVPITEPINTHRLTGFNTALCTAAERKRARLTESQSAGDQTLLLHSYRCLGFICAGREHARSSTPAAGTHSKTRKPGFWSTQYQRHSSSLATASTSCSRRPSITCKSLLWITRLWAVHEVAGRSSVECMELFHPSSPTFLVMTILGEQKRLCYCCSRLTTAGLAPAGSFLVKVSLVVVSWHPLCVKAVWNLELAKLCKSCCVKDFKKELRFSFVTRKCQYWARHYVAAWAAGIALPWIPSGR